MKKITFLLLSTLAFFQVNAQKLPNVQQVSLRAPATIKIDGKAKEWDGQLQAYNKATGIFYTISNDNENLYLIIHSNNFDITTKILAQGINISFNARKKSTEGSLLIKYPITPGTQQEKNERANLVNSTLSSEGAKRGNDNAEQARLRYNRAVVTANKFVKMSGAKGITDTLLSIYDAKGIAVGLDCPGENLLYYELSIPLKYLETSPSALTQLYYNIRLNENWRTHLVGPEEFKGRMPGGNDAGMVYFATDFWGEYTLAK